MNCDTIAAILDDHRSERLDPAERQAVTGHLGGCSPCAAEWAAQHALLGENIGEPAPDLYARVLRHAALARELPGHAGRRGRLALGSLAAAAAIAAVAVAARLWIGAPDTSDTPALEVATPATDTRTFVAGRDYEALSLPATTASDGRIAVAEFFMYLCFPCYAFEPDLESWHSAAPDYVALTRVPAVFNPEAELHARAFYTADALGKLDAIHAAFYDEIHMRGNRLASREALAAFFARFGIHAATFAEVFDSSAIDAKVRQAVALSREYGIRATPALVVAGRYSTNPSLAGTQVLAVVDQLVATEAEQAAARCAAGADSPTQPRAYCAWRNNR